MPNFTKFFKLRKPLPEEFYNIEEHNDNMDIIDEQLKILSEDSGVVISPDEPETGDVWIDTDDDGGEGGFGGAVTSVNGKTGDVNLTAKDVDAYPVGETYSKTEVNALLKNKADNSHTQPASTITGLAEFIGGLGYGKVKFGTYVGDGSGTVAFEHTSMTSGWNKTTYSPRKISFGFTPTLVMLLYVKSNRLAYLDATTAPTTTAGTENSDINENSNTYTTKIAYLEGSDLCLVNGGSLDVPSYDTPKTFTVSSSRAYNSAGITYYWIAFA